MPNRTGKFIIKYTATLKWVTLCLVTVLISNCMATGPKYPDIFLQDTSKAMVVIYRPPPPITVPVEYIEWPPSIYHGGEKLIELGEIQGTVNINTKSGLYYYLRYVPFRYKGLFPADPYEFKVVPTGFAREELIDARYQLLLK
jgi:hypothetical protein